jgi:hypothetical protein
MLSLRGATRRDGASVIVIFTSSLAQLSDSCVLQYLLMANKSFCNVLLLTTFTTGEIKSFTFTYWAHNVTCKIIFIILASF